MVNAHWQLPSHSPQKGAEPSGAAEPWLPHWQSARAAAKGAGELEPVSPTRCLAKDSQKELPGSSHFLREPAGAGGEHPPNPPSTLGISPGSCPARIPTRLQRGARSLLQWRSCWLPAPQPTLAKWQTPGAPPSGHAPSCLPLHGLREAQRWYPLASRARTPPRLTATELHLHQRHDLPASSSYLPSGSQGQLAGAAPEPLQLWPLARPGHSQPPVASIPPIGGRQSDAALPRGLPSRCQRCVRLYAFACYESTLPHVGPQRLPRQPTGSLPRPQRIPHVGASHSLFAQLPAPPTQSGHSIPRRSASAAQSPVQPSPKRAPASPVWLAAARRLPPLRLPQPAGEGEPRIRTSPWSACSAH
mmetsp:Transcript_97376/g.223165  ORF Transcript_97376/g.223165 Transcript_97376/m.223165 type:complete len:360 (-) Transcript_97376:474-1553(-)